MILESGGESRECLNQYTQQVTLLSRDLGGGIGEWLRVKGVSNSVHPMSNLVV